MVESAEEGDSKRSFAGIVRTTGFRSGPKGGHCLSPKNEGLDDR